MQPRIGVLYTDGSINIVMQKNRSYAEQEAEARSIRDDANKGETAPTRLAKLVSIDLEDRDIVEIDNAA